MSLWRQLWDTEGKQRNDIDSATQAIDEVSAAASAQAEEARYFARKSEERLDRLELLLESLFCHLEQSGSIDRQKFAALVEQVDLADGNLDGRISVDVSHRTPKCQACGKPVARKRKHCIYCGAAVETGRRR